MYTGHEPFCRRVLALSRTVWFNRLKRAGFPGFHRTSVVLMVGRSFDISGSTVLDTFWVHASV